MTKPLGHMTRCNWIEGLLNITGVVVQVHFREREREREREIEVFFIISWHPLLYKESRAGRLWRRLRISFSFSSELTPLLSKEN